jgi:hypothetical protein
LQDRHSRVNFSVSASDVILWAGYGTLGGDFAVWGDKFAQQGLTFSLPPSIG